MKTALKLATLIGVSCASLFTLQAADKVQAGPKGGRLLGRTTPAAEFFVESNRTISISFYDGAMKPVPAGEQKVLVIADTKAGRKKIEFERKGDLLVSKTSLPEGDNYGLVVQVTPSADAKPQNFRFTLDTSRCGGCQRAEYACTCHE